jgi:hypothetical protein
MMRPAAALWLGPLLAGMSGCSGAQLAWVGHTPDRSALVQVHQDGQGQWLTLGSRASRRYRFIAAEDLAFGADAGRFAFAAQLGSRPERWSVVTDFVEGAAWDGVAALQFGPGGRRLVYAAEQGAGWRMVVDGSPERAFESLDPGSVTFSPDGRRVGYVAQDGVCARAVIDAVPGPCAAHIVGLALADVASRDVLATADAPDGKSGHVFVGAERVADLESIREVVVDPGVRHWAAVAAASSAFRVVVDGREQESFDRIEHVTWAAHGRTLAYTAWQDGAWHVVLDGRPGPPHADVEEPVFAARGERFGYVARDPGRSVVAVDDRIVWESAAPATALTFSDDGERLAWIYRDAGTTVIAVDQERFPFEVAIERTLRFSRDGKHWAALVGSRKLRQLFVVIDGHVQLPFDAVEFFGSPGGDAGARLGAWVSGELAEYLARGESERGRRR